MTDHWICQVPSLWFDFHSIPKFPNRLIQQGTHEEQLWVYFCPNSIFACLCKNQFCISSKFTYKRAISSAPIQTCPVLHQLPQHFSRVSDTLLFKHYFCRILFWESSLSCIVYQNFQYLTFVYFTMKLISFKFFTNFYLITFKDFDTKLKIMYFFVIRTGKVFT